MLHYNLLLQGELIRAVTALRTAEIDCVVLKGIPLAHELYGGLSARPMRDNDLLVPPGKAELAHATLRELGYRSASRHSFDVDRRFGFQHLMRRERAGQLVSLELHWHAFTPRLFRTPVELLWRHTRDILVGVGGAKLRVFDEQLCLVHLAAHFVQHNCAQPRILRDLALGWSQWGQRIERDALWQLAEQAHAQHALAYAFAAAQRAGLIDASVTCWSSRRARLLARLRPATVTRTGSYMQALTSVLVADPPAAWRGLLRAAFPPPALLASLHGRALSPALYLRYLSRPFRPLARWLGWHPHSRSR